MYDSCIFKSIIGINHYIYTMYDCCIFKSIIGINHDHDHKQKKAIILTVHHRQRKYVVYCVYSHIQ